jgi:valyl-tRNA synthetase
MKNIELPKAYNPQEFEDRIYSRWEKQGAFRPSDGSDDSGRDGERGGDPFVIVIPPPNVTGVLHMGHGLNNALQDILIRYYRMVGRPTLWVPGTDHAGIATQNVVERKLRERGTNRREIGRDKFVEETWKIKEEHHGIITRQLRKIGASCDWSRERFTLDEGLSRAVREVFVRLYESGQIYRGEYLVNWCSSCGTALSDDEVEHREISGRMYRYYYPLSDGSGKLMIATTRPETMLGDTAVAVHPEDERYAGLVGKTVDLPLTGRTIPIVADTFVDREFGTGAVKVTPAHDANDWAIGERHDLERINILNPNGTLNDSVPEPYRGLAVKEARKRMVADLKESGVYVDDTEHVHQVGHCYRCNTAIEPYISEQWFVRMRPLAAKALAAWEKGEIEFFPRKWENTYTHWLRNIRDWCISRQLWWGHRIPVWYCAECDHMTVAKEDPTACEGCGGTQIRQDEDVLDTWFSSWLWPFSTLGWPEETKDLETFYPTSALVTGYDIIFFWVSRMIMAGLEFMGEVPFRDIYITGLVRDKQGRKMSKSLGNGIDPLEIVEAYGADAMKFTLCFLAAQGQDVLIDKESFKLGSKFANKVWNATRYLLMNLEGRELMPAGAIEYTHLDRWIYHRLNEAVKATRRAVESYRFNDGASAVYEFFWNDFCDWYVEASKLSLYSEDEAEKNRAITILLSILEESLRLMHPFLSFVTEEIYGKLPGVEGSLIRADYPAEDPRRDAPQVNRCFTALQELIRSVRTLRSEFTIPPERRAGVYVKLDSGFSHGDFFRDHGALITALVGASTLEFGDTLPPGNGSIPVAGNGFEAYVDIREAIDVPREVEKLGRERKKLSGLVEGTQRKLANEKFLENAPADVVEKERQKMDEFEGRLEKVARYLEQLS